MEFRSTFFLLAQFEILVILYLNGEGLKVPDYHSPQWGVKIVCSREMEVGSK